MTHATIGKGDTNKAEIQSHFSPGNIDLFLFFVIRYIWEGFNLKWVVSYVWCCSSHFSGERLTNEFHML